MNLFDVIPSNFFNYLASGSNQRIYADCLYVIYQQYEREISYRIPRVAVRDALAAFISENHIELEDDEEDQPSLGDMASDILRHFCDCGWLEEETDDNTYEKQIMMSERGILLAEFLENLKKPETEEYSGYIFQIFNILNNKDLWKEHPYVNGLKGIFKSAKELAGSLKKLSTFIRKIIEKMVTEETLETLTDNLLDYLDGSFIKEYARLTGQQNIHIYRGKIRKELDRIKEDAGLSRKLCDECATEEGITASEAQALVYDMLQTSRQFLTDDYDRIMRDIKHKINVYLQVAVGRARFLRNKEADNKGLVENVIKILAEEQDQLKGFLDEETSALFRFEKNEFIDLNSLRFPGRVTAIKSVTSDVARELSEEDIGKARKQQEKEAYNPYSKGKMKKYLDELMADRRSLRTEDMPLESKSDMLCAMSAIAYAKDNGYRVVPGEGYVETEKMILREVNIEKAL